MAVTSVNGGMRLKVRTNQAKAAALTTESTTPSTWSLTARLNSSSSTTTVPTLAAIPGPISGAITIDPTTTAGESSNSPAVAITALMTVITT